MALDALLAIFMQYSRPRF